MIELVEVADAVSMKRRGFMLHVWLETHLTGAILGRSALLAGRRCWIGHTNSGRRGRPVPSYMCGYHSSAAIHISSLQNLE